MTSRITSLSLTLFATSLSAFGAAFIPNNLAIYRVGDGSAALTNAATAVFIDEYTTGGELVQSIALPTATSGSTFALTANGTAVSEGLLNRSVDGRFLTLTGYSAAVGTAGVTATAGTSVPRTVGFVDDAGNVDTTTTTTRFGTTNIRGSISGDGTGVHLTGTNSGVVYMPRGGSGLGTQVATNITNLRDVGIFNGQLYVSSGATGLRIGSVGTGTPTTSGETITSLPGFSTTTGQPYQFMLFDLSATVDGLDTLYAADEGGTIQKFSLVDGNWSGSGSVIAPGVRGLTGVADGSTVSLFATAPTTLFSFVDSTGYNRDLSGSAIAIATAGANTAFRGLDFTPIPEPGSLLSLVAGMGVLGLISRFRGDRA